MEVFFYVYKEDVFEFVVEKIYIWDLELELVVLVFCGLVLIIDVIEKMCNDILVRNKFICFLILRVLIFGKCLLLVVIFYVLFWKLIYVLYVFCFLLRICVVVLLCKKMKFWEWFVILYWEFWCMNIVRKGIIFVLLIK